MQHTHVLIVDATVPGRCTVCGSFGKLHIINDFCKFCPRCYNTEPQWFNIATERFYAQYSHVVINEAKTITTLGYQDGAMASALCDSKPKGALPWITQLIPV